MTQPERITLAIDSNLLARFDSLLAARGLGNRSEAMRDLIRARLVDEDTSTGGGDAVASLTLLYDHDQRELSERLVEAGHHVSGAEVIASMHVHLDERFCLELLALRGPLADLRRFADGVLGLKGVLHGQLVVSSPATLSGPAPSSARRPSRPRPHTHPHVPEPSRRGKTARHREE